MQIPNLQPDEKYTLTLESQYYVDWNLPLRLVLLEYSNGSYHYTFQNQNLAIVGGEFNVRYLVFND